MILICSVREGRDTWDGLAKLVIKWAEDHEKHLYREDNTLIPMTLKVFLVFSVLFSHILYFET